MSNETHAAEPPKPARLDAIPTALIDRIERYGIATVLLLLLIYWAKPHVDEAIRSHNKLIEKTVDVQAEQANTLKTANQILERVDRTATDTNNVVHEIKAATTGNATAKNPKP